MCKDLDVCVSCDALNAVQMQTFQSLQHCQGCTLKTNGYTSVLHGISSCSEPSMCLGRTNRCFLLTMPIFMQTCQHS